MPSIVQVQVSQIVAPTPNLLQKKGCLISVGSTNLAQGGSSFLASLDSLTPLIHGALAIQSLLWSQGLVTVTTTAPHGLSIGVPTPVSIVGVIPQGYNGTVTATATSTTVFTYPLAVNPGLVTKTGNFTVANVSELYSMAVTFFSQGQSQGVWVLELGPATTALAIQFLSQWITANAGNFYSYLVPREWDGDPNLMNLMAQYENSTAKTYFFVTTTLQNYGLYTPLQKCAIVMIEAPQMQSYPANPITAASWLAGELTFTTTTPHGVHPGTWFQINGMVPNTFNGWFLADTTTTGSSLTVKMTTTPGVATSEGTLVASGTDQPALPATEFSLASAFYVALNYYPSTTNRVTPFAFSFLFGVTPFPVIHTQALLTILQQSAINVVGTGAEGGISDAILLWGTTMDGNDFTYWYSVDWVQINADLAVANAVINGSNNPINPLYYNQDGIDRLEGVVYRVMARGVSYGLVLFGPTMVRLDGQPFIDNINAGTYTGFSVVNAVPFIQYSQENPSDYKIGRYAGLSVLYTPNRGFINILINVLVTELIVQ